MKPPGIQLDVQYSLLPTELTTGSAGYCDLLIDVDVTNPLG